MRKLLVITLLIISSGSNAQSISQIAKNTIQSTVAIIALDKNLQPMALGSGAIIDSNTIITNYHVVSGAEELKIIIVGRQTPVIANKFYCVDYTNDLILLQTSENINSPIQIENNDSLEVGDKIFAVGNPKGLTGTFSEGIVSGKRSLDERNLIQITAPISPGSSGGPVVNLNGKLIGIAVGSYTEGQNLNFAIPAFYIKNLLRKRGLYDLNILEKKNINQNNDNTTDILSAVIVKNISVYSYAYDYYVSYSVFNNLDKPIADLKLLLIIMDKNGEPKDYNELDPFDFDYSKDGIRPHLAKTFRFQLTGVGKPIESVMSGKDKIVIKLLDFKIID